MTLGKRIAEARGLADLSQGKLAQLCNLADGTTISRYERDAAKPSVDVLVAIADHTGATTDFLLGRSEAPQPSYRGLSRQAIEAAKDIDSLPRAMREHFHGILAQLRPLATHKLLSELLAYDHNNVRHRALMAHFENEAQSRREKDS